MKSLRPHQELILLSASTKARRASARIRIKHLTSSIDWNALLSSLTRARLLPTLGPCIAAMIGEEGSDDFRRAALESVSATRRQDALLLLTEQRLADALNKDGILTAPLKGPNLGEEIYGEPGRRLSSDIDMLLPPECLRDGVEVVRALGYSAPTDPVGPNGLPLLHFTMQHQDGTFPAVELHWRIHWYERRFAAERLLAPELDSKGWRSKPADALIALLLYYARDGLCGLRQATDLAAWWDCFGEQLDPDGLENHLKSYPQLQSAVATAARVAERTVGLPSRRLLPNNGALGPRARIAMALANPQPYTTPQQLYAEIGLIDGLLTPRGGFRSFLRRQVVPPQAVILDHASKALDARITSRTGYASRVLGRYAIALGRLLCIPGTKRPRFSTSKLA
ncbi:MAG: nucleotidyltransferase family protein [Solirubrobacterales bacterium]